MLDVLEIMELGLVIPWFYVLYMVHLFAKNLGIILQEYPNYLFVHLSQ